MSRHRFESERRWRGVLAAVLLVEFLVLALCVRDDVTLSGNESSRFATVEALVERGTFEIEGGSFPTVDRVQVDGRFYSNKPLLFSVVLSGLYAPLHLVGGASFAVSYHGLIVALTVLGVCSCSVLLTYLMQRRLRRVGAPRSTALALGLAAVFSTWVFSYGTTLNNHTPAALLVFALCFLLEDGARRSDLRSFAAGLVAGLLVGVEIPTGGAFACAGGLALLGARPPFAWRNLAPYVAGAGAVTLALAGLNLAVYGYPLDAYLVPGAFDFEGSIHAAGAGGLRRPDDLPRYWFHVLLGQRGVFSHMPALACGLVYCVARWRKQPLAEQLWASAILVLFLFYGTYTGIYGGWAYGFRFLIPILPVLFWWAARWYLEAPPGRSKALFGGLLAAGLLTSWLGAHNPWPVAYEGVATSSNEVEDRVRAPALSNLLVARFERDPEDPLFRWLAAEVYGHETTVGYLRKEFTNRRQPELARAAEAWAGSS